MIGNLRVLGLITARGGSKGVPGKNILPVAGQPLIQWTITAALASKHIDRLILSTDDQSIMDVAEAAGCEVPFRRSKELATDDATSASVVVDALQRVPGFNIVVLLQPTSPLRNAADIDGAIQLLVSNAAPACVSLRPVEDHPYWTFRIDENHCISRFLNTEGALPTRRQDLPGAWCLNGAVYVALVDWFLRERTFLSGSTVGFPMPSERSLDIDTHADMERFRTIAEGLSSNSDS